jgi:hypothetical protein
MSYQNSHNNCCDNCNFYGFPCINCSTYGHICQSSPPSVYEEPYEDCRRDCAQNDEELDEEFYEEEQPYQLIQHSHCDNCFFEFTCDICTRDGFPCLNCEAYGHICSFNCEPLPMYPGSKYPPPGLCLPPPYVEIE